MFKDISRARLVGFWFVAVAIITAWVVATGVNVTITTVAFLLAMSLVPPAITLLLWRGAPPPTVAELLYSVNKQKEGRS